MEAWLTHFEGFFQTYGYAAIFLVLLLENAGIPVPGETTLLYTSFLASRGERLHLPGIMFIAMLAAVTGDSAGYWLGRKGGAKVAHVLRLTPSRLAIFHNFFERYGNWTVFFARFIAGLRIIAGPAAGLSGMEWRRFLTFNAMGAVTWVTCISLVGFYLGQNWSRLLQFVREFNIGAAIVGLLVAGSIALRRRASRKRGAGNG